MFTQRGGVYRVTCLCSSCSQPVPPSPVEENQVWLAVNEDGLCVLDLTMVGTESTRVQLRRAVAGNYVTLVPRTRWSHIPTSAWLPLAVVVTTSWWLAASRGSLALGGGAWRSWCLPWLNRRWVHLTHIWNTDKQKPGLDSG